jgi:regulator of sirC expression with transglutaminase-like and TPR domain
MSESSHTDEARRRFAEIVSRDDDQINLAEAALYIAAEEYPRIDVSLYLERLDKFADLALELASEASGPHETIAALNAALFDELGFCGNRENYYDPRNSYLNEVIDRRTGIPITLTLVYMEVARRIGFEVAGVGLPGHFIAKHPSGSGDIYIDAFDRGEIMGVAGCEALFREVTGGRADMRSEYLAVVTNKQLLTRMLSNLLSIYSKSDHRRALGIVERMILINPETPAHVRDRGLLLANIGETGEALRELEHYLALAPDAIDASLIRQQISSIKQQRARWN